MPSDSLPHDRIVVIGASAGGVDALLDLATQLPAEFPAPILVVIHVPADSPSVLPEILTRRGNLEARHARNGEVPRAGVIYIAPPDRHLLVGSQGQLGVTRGPRENRHRPSVDPLFRSAAGVYRNCVVAVVLSGTLDDGTAGMIAVARENGITIVQDPEDALYPSMPANVLRSVDVDHIVPVRQLSATLREVLAAPAPHPSHHHDRTLLEIESKIAQMEPHAMAIDSRPGQPSAFSCPDCGGVLWEIEDGDYTRYRCRVGHAYSPESMLGAQENEMEEAMWAAMKTLEESARLSHKLAADERQRGHGWLVDRFEEKERHARKRAEVIREFLEQLNGRVPVPVETEPE